MFARAVARQAGLPYVELDSLRYQPNWKKTADEEFNYAVISAAGADEWVIDGNYEAARDLVWIRARLLIWMDYPLRITLWRLLRRTVNRLQAGEVFANGNRESFWRLLGPNSIFLWAIRSYYPRRRNFEKLVAKARYSHLRVLRFRLPCEADAWLAQQEPATGKIIATSLGAASCPPQHETDA